MSATVIACTLPGASGAIVSVQGRVRVCATGDSAETWPTPSTARTRSVKSVAQGRLWAISGAALPRAITLLPGEELVASDVAVVS